MEAGLRESRTLEFKATLPERNESFLKTVTSFANTNGGDVIYGITDSREVKGIADSDVERAIDRLQDTINNGVEPRLHGVEFGQVRLGTGASLLMVRVPPSVAAP